MINYAPPRRKDYLQAFVTQWRVGERSVFLKNVIANLNLLATDGTPEAWQLVVWAYQEAQILKRSSDCDVLKRHLLESPEMASKLAQVERAIPASRVERRLSPMGRLALRSADWDLIAAVNDAALWKDFGMISLGFFRILELEFNERLILPMSKELDTELFEKKLSDLGTQGSQGAVKKAFESWDRMRRQINRAREDGKGFELGAIELLLRKLAEPEGIDASIKAVFRSVLVKRLSADGFERFASGELATLIGEPPRERFRNPPAHTRYVSLRTAQACKKYVEDALEILIACTTNDADGASTVH